MRMKHKIIDGKKPCSKCKENLDVSKFHKDMSNSSGLTNNCISCDVLRNLKRTSSAKYKVYKRDFDLRKNYNITLEDFNSMLKSQENRCKICSILYIPGQNKEFCVDHCHKTGKVRGVLCNNCNRMLGFIKDSIEILDKAKIYLIENL